MAVNVLYVNTNHAHLGSVLMWLAVAVICVACGVGFLRERHRQAQRFDQSLNRLRTPITGDLTAVPDSTVGDPVPTVFREVHPDTLRRIRRLAHESIRREAADELDREANQ